MKYFCTKEQIEGRGTCWHEFVRGVWDDRMWGEDSLYLSDDMLCSTGLGKLLRRFVEDYDRCGVSEVYPDEWDAAAEGEAADAAAEIDGWAREAFAESGVFTILGI